MNGAADIIMPGTLEAQEQQNQKMMCIPYDDAKRIAGEVRADVEKQRKTLMPELHNARALACFGDEWSKVKSRPVGTDKLQLGIASGLVELVVGTVFDADLNATVRVTSKPNVDEIQAQQLQKMFGVPLAIDPKRPQWLMEMMGELKTHELDSYRRSLKIRSKAREAFRRALVDRCGVLKDSHYNRPRNTHDVSVLIYGDEYLASLGRNYEKVSWHIHDQSMEKADFAREYPWILARYAGNEPSGTAGWWRKINKALERFYRSEDSSLYLKKARELEKNSIKIREIWYELPEGRPGVEQFPGGIVVMTVFEDEVLRVVPNPYMDGRHPFHTNVPLPAEDSWAGRSWIYAHHDGIMAMNQVASMALLNLIDSCNNYRLWNPSALTPESVEQITNKDIGTRELVLKANKTWDQAVKELQPAQISASVFSVMAMVQSLVYAATGINLRKEKTTSPDGMTVGGDTAMGPQIALMMDTVKEQYESLFYCLCTRGSQFSPGPQSFTLAGEATVSITMNPQIFWDIFGDKFYDSFIILVDEIEPLPDDPKERREDMKGRLELAGDLVESTGMTMDAAVTWTRPENYTIMARDMKRRRLEQEQNPNKQPTPKQEEKIAIADTEKMKSIAQVWQHFMQSEGNIEFVRNLMATGQLRASLDSAIVGKSQVMIPVRSLPSEDYTVREAGRSVKAPPIAGNAPRLNPQVVN